MQKFFSFFCVPFYFSFLDYNNLKTNCDIFTPPPPPCQISGPVVAQCLVGRAVLSPLDYLSV